MSRKIQVLLVEDELIIADYMQECLQKLGYEVCGVCINYSEAIEALHSSLPDIVLVDITLKGAKNGIDVGNYIRQNYQIPFVFATSHSDKNTIDTAKKALPYAYLIKPFSEEDLYAVIETALMHYGRQKSKEELPSGDDTVLINNAVFIKHKSKFVKIILDDLVYVEANDNYCNLFTASAGYALKTTLKTLLDLLPEYFLRVHRSYVINLRHLKGFDADMVSVLNKELPIGKSFFPMLMERLKIIQG